MKHPLKDNGIITPKPNRVLKLTASVILFSAIILILVMACAAVTWGITNAVTANRSQAAPTNYNSEYSWELPSDTAR